jgi:cytochrome c
MTMMRAGLLPAPRGIADGSKNDRGRITHGLIPTHCLCVTTNGTGDMRSYKMGRSMRKAGLVLMAVLGSSATAMAAGDSSAGQTVFATHCVACHSTQAGKNEVGPSLAGIVGSKSASIPGYDFSPAMKDANITWDDANLEKFLANPAGFIPGTKMFINLPSDTDRQNVIAYLNTLKK